MNKVHPMYMLSIVPVSCSLGLLFPHMSGLGEGQMAKRQCRSADTRISIGTSNEMNKEL